jgi:hypothetical protein
MHFDIIFRKENLMYQYLSTKKKNKNIHNTIEKNQRKDDNRKVKIHNNKNHLYNVGVVDVRNRVVVLKILEIEFKSNSIIMQ